MGSRKPFTPGTILTEQPALSKRGRHAALIHRQQRHATGGRGDQLRRGLVAMRCDFACRLPEVSGDGFDDGGDGADQEHQQPDYSQDSHDDGGQGVGDADQEDGDEAMQETDDDVAQEGG